MGHVEGGLGWGGCWPKRHIVPYGGWVGADRNAVLYHMVQYGTSVLLGIAIHCRAFSRIVHGIVLYGLILMIALSDIVGVPLSRIVAYCWSVIVPHCCLCIVAFALSRIVAHSKTRIVLYPLHLIWYHIVQYCLVFRCIEFSDVSGQKISFFTT